MQKNWIIEEYKKLHNFSDDDFNSLYDIDSIVIHDGSLFTDFDKFEQAILNIGKDDRVIVHPDYDADGVMAGLIAKISLDTFEIGRTEIYYPKTEFGYGLNTKAIDEIIEMWPDVKYIITVDNGISTKEATAYAVEKGINVIVTDHHEQSAGKFPDKAIAVINPNRIDKDESYPFKSIAGAEVIWKLMRAIADRNFPWKSKIINNLQVFASISIVSDVMPVINENRRLLKETTSSLKNELWLLSLVNEEGAPLSYKKAILGLHNILTVLKEKGTLKSGFTYDTIGFNIAPMLNAPRRMLDTSKETFDIFLSDMVESKVAANYVYEINEQRKLEVALASQKVAKWASTQNLDDIKGIVYQADDLRGGIAGLVAGKIADKYKVPAIALSKSLHGSGRTIEGVNLHALLSNIENIDSSVFNKWGGHKAAVGLSLSKAKLEEFTRLFNEEAKKIEIEPFVEKTIKLSLNNLPTIEDVKSATKQFENIKPYSSDVPEPIFELEFEPLDVLDAAVRKDIHMSIKLFGIDIMIWNSADIYNSVNKYDPVKIVVKGNLSLNTFGSRTAVQLSCNKIEIKDL